MKKIFLIIGYCLLGTLFVFNIFASVYFVTDNTERIFEENILKVVEVRASDDESTWAHATGFFIDKNGTIITNKHVVFNPITNECFNYVNIRTATNQEYEKAEVIKVSEIHDLAMIKVNFSNTSYFRFADEVNNGETVYTIGNPNGFGLSFSQGVISSKSRNVVFNNKTINAIQTSIVVNDGNSGGPLFNKDGKLLGIISFRLKDNTGNVIQGCSFALPVKTINEFINV